MRNQISSSKVGGWLITAFNLIKANGGQMHFKDFTSKMEKDLYFSEHEKGQYSSGSVRWKTKLNYYSIACVKARWLKKNKSVWSLTPLGERALEYSVKEFIDKMKSEYEDWDKNNKLPKTVQEEKRS